MDSEWNLFTAAEEYQKKPDLIDYLQKMVGCPKCRVKPIISKANKKSTAICPICGTYIDAETIEDLTERWNKALTQRN